MIAVEKLGTQRRKLPEKDNLLTLLPILCRTPESTTAPICPEYLCKRVSHVYDCGMRRSDRHMTEVQIIGDAWILFTCLFSICSQTSP